MIKYTLALFLAIAVPTLWAQTAADVPKTDRLGQALEKVGLSRNQLGFHPKGYWNRFPQPRHIPHILPFFEDLFAEPMKVYDFAKTMGNAVAYYLDPVHFDTAGNCLYNLVYLNGVDRKLIGFRNFGVNLNPRIDEAQPMLDAFERIYEAYGGRLEFMTFNKISDWPNPRRRLEMQLDSVPIEIQKPIAALMLNLLDASRWRNIAVRNVNFERQKALFDIKDLAETIGDGQVYYPEIDDVAAALDEHSLYYAAMKTVQAAETCYRDLKTAVTSRKHNLSRLHFEFDSPLGKVIIRGTGDDEARYVDAAVLIDLGGDDRHSGNCGASISPEKAIAVMIDIAGRDRYENEEAAYPSQGSAVLGAGILIDGSGDDSYAAERQAQGCALFGLGLLLDIEGDDDYRIKTSGQGCGYFGLGFALDIKGKDKRYICGDGQGFGGVGGIGICADYFGDDEYVAEPLASVFNRGDYHSENKINVNSAQGAGMGRRGDGSDGHSWAGGLGALIDIKGDDSYYSGNWTLGCGYWFGTGIVYDGEGDDRYRSVYFTQASGAHFCIGALIDETGNDLHELRETAGAGLAFGWDYTIALLVNRGGDDRYIAKIISLACAQIRSDAFFFDIGGDDYYQLGRGTDGLGSATYRDSYDKPNRFSPYDYYANSIALFLDIGGLDRYVEIDQEGKSSIPTIGAADNSIWLSPAKDSGRYGAGNFGIGMDAAEGLVPELEIFNR